ncbi:hypothetical protein NITMOv2_3268 [Nitrospira moscoviensis]|uniref:Uncharacterized protein n=2 Tax=Nitrospira moscoviensis TaxID=42253 RepID=A0A0K2GGA8_NITMO|nr:hypothetical protein NITMOv2_3268 [Nitrospira moscoviensis]
MDERDIAYRLSGKGSHRLARVGDKRKPELTKLATVNPSMLTGAALPAATLARVALTPVFGSGYTFITFYPAIMPATVIAGGRYGFTAA